MSRFVGLTQYKERYIMSRTSYFMVIVSDLGSDLTSQGKVENNSQAILEGVFVINYKINI